ncbi:AfsR/SARP family transcriptional regulator [Stackebrandtia nassauensis]|uniref:Transcriptional regulator, SARP family n=1 Tax=Stackebrandtia nassauensis (strain DSM 44728 / CIP 108903 / NRRL B-16338 / NBRC 102104 / LLR-40K-21) TaxID=446470 RepID=D3Q803_STANL|nr:BTAD domain-containing putative transcriptional regulator [Stackebrandtia nassauensis]ADD40508.1 transcriptional regulator, SARP family [Stackebrandtia nassauensis DSM 44728]
MEVRLLGPLEVLRDGTPVPIRGRIHPRLLAVLALHAGNVVARPALITGVWDCEPPASAKRQIQNAVSALRQVLDGTLIETVGDGYRLRLDDVTVDARDFETTVAEAARQRAGGDSDAALTSLRDALALWRGEALAGLPGRELRSRAQRLEEAWLAAREELIDVELELGEPVPVGELGELARLHPYRQRLTGLYMRVLHRQGRTPDALRVFDDIRRRLLDELGITVGPALRELHTAILREDPRLDAAAPVAVPASPAAAPRLVPAQLPAAIGEFVGRQEQLARLDALIAKGDNTALLSTVSGTGGAGKTALAIHWAHHNRDRFPDGQLYVNLRAFDRAEPLTPYDALTRFLAALGVTGGAVPSDVEAAASLYRSLLDGRRMLVLLDNAVDLEQVRPLLPGSGGNVTLVTSRNRITGLTALHGAELIGVDTMSRTESLEVLGNLVGARRLHADAAAAHRLAELCADLPLALRIAGANLAVNSHVELSEYVRELAGPNRLELLSIEGDPDSAVASVFAQSFRALSPEAQRLFARLGWIPGDDFGEELAIAVADLPEADCRRLTRTLETGNLVERYQARRFRFHDLVREYARQQAENTLDDAERDAVADRVVQWYYDNRRTPRAEDYPNLVATFQTWRHHPRCLMLPSVFAQHVNAGRDLAGMRAHLDAAYALAKSLGEPLSVHRAADALAVLAWAKGDTGTAVEFGLESLANAMSHDGDALGTARANLGLHYAAHGDYRKAEPLQREALEVAVSQAAAGAPNRGLNLVNLYCGLGRYADATTLVERIRHMPGIDANDLVLGAVHRIKAQIHMNLGRYGEALAEIEAGLRLAGQRSQPRSESIALRLRAEIRRRAGDLTNALADATRALELARRHQLSKQEKDAVFELAALHCASGTAQKAEELVPSLAETARDSSGPQRAEALARLAELHFRRGRHAEAIECGMAAKELFASIPRPLGLARVLRDLAEIHDDLAETETARGFRAEALDLFTRLRVPEAEELRRQLDSPPSDLPQTPPSSTPVRRLRSSSTSLYKVD